VCPAAGYMFARDPRQRDALFAGLHELDAVPLILEGAQEIKRLPPAPLTTDLGAFGSVSEVGTWSSSLQEVRLERMSAVATARTLDWLPTYLIRRLTEILSALAMLRRVSREGFVRTPRSICARYGWVSLARCASML
jgi:hypothetical protein